MPKYLVTLIRTERIAFEVVADSPEQANDNALGGGEEIDAETVDMITESIVEISS